MSFGDAASIDFRTASPVVPTDPPQAEGFARRLRLFRSQQLERALFDG